MELIHLGVKSVTYWIFSLLILAFCLSVNTSENKPEDMMSLNLNSLIKVEPRYLYRNENKFNALVVGELKLEFKLDNIESDITPYNLIVISNLEYKTNTNITLKWQVDHIEHQTPLNLNKQSKTQIDFKANDTSQIHNLHLLINQDTTLGTEHSFQDEISFQSIYLDHMDNQNSLKTHLSQWAGFNPIRFSSINSYTENTNLIYKTLILRLSIWLTSTVFLFFIFNLHTKHLFSSIFIAWLITTTIHLNNHLHQNQQIKNSFTNQSTNLNLVDVASSELANSIKNELADLKIKNLIENKIILIGGNIFFNQRLLQHLNQFNISLNLLNSDIFRSKQQSIKTYIFFGNTIIYCNDLKHFSDLNQSIVIISAKEDFCIARDR